MSDPRPKVWSLRRRLLAWLLVSTLVLGTLALIDTRAEALRTADQLADRILAGSAMVIAERAALDENGVLAIAIPYGALEMLSSAAQDRVFYRVDSKGEMITGYSDLPLIPSALGAAPRFADVEYRGTKLRVASITRTVSTGIDEVAFSVTMAETTLAREALSRDILLRSAIRLLGMILGAAAIVWIAVTLSLRPLRRLEEAIDQRSPQDLRPVQSPVPSEVQAPMNAVNSLLERLRLALEGLRNFTGNASHQLRTPMMVMRTQLALALRAQTLPQAQEAAHRADQALSRAERVLTQLLALARVDAAQGAAVSMQPFEITPVLRDLTAEHIPAAAESGVDLGLEIQDSAQPYLARIEPLLFAEALHNLISNAILHGGDLVTVRLSRQNAMLCIEVEDNGRGIDEADRARVLRRFGRAGAEAKETGMGLGLPIVQEIISLFGGRLDLLPAPQSGLIARLTLPEA